MHVYVLDEENELDLELKVNDILLSYNDDDIVDIKYSVSAFYDNRDQVYCFSCMIIVKN
jgi:ACT domain-containing protein